MNDMAKEVFIESFEVISRAADDCTYILADSNNLTNEEIATKLYARINRIGLEIGALEERMDYCFEETDAGNTIGASGTK